VPPDYRLPDDVRKGDPRLILLRLCGKFEQRFSPDDSQSCQGFGVVTGRSGRVDEQHVAVGGRGEARSPGERVQSLTLMVRAALSCGHERCVAAV
jgi:hypothetical protein